MSDGWADFHRPVPPVAPRMSTVAYLAVSPEGRTDRHCLLLSEDTLPGLRRLTDAVHAEGAAAAAQIGHAGPVANARSNGAPALSPSGGFTPMGSRLRAVDAAGIERITEDYRRAAALAVAAGFDSIEVHVGHNYLLSAFLSPKLNRRDDQFGGSVENRARFARMVLRTVRDAVGPNVAVTAKLNMADGVDGGLWLDESVEIARALRGRRRAPCVGAHRGQLAGQPDVPLPGRRAAPGVRRHAARRRSGSASASSATASCAPTPTRRRSSSPTRASSTRALHAAHPARRHHGAGDDRDGPGRGVRLRRHGPCPPARARPAQAHAGGAATPSLCIHCNKCMPTIYSGTRCVLVTLTALVRLRGDRRPALRPRRRPLELSGEGQQRLLVAETADELHADGQPAVAPVQRQRNRRAGRSR